jgi:hypothetical protein
MFVDESGDACMKKFCNPNSEHLCLNGVIIRLEDCYDIEIDINILKMEYFNIDAGSNNYPLHRKEILSRTPPFDSLADEEIRNRFNTELLSFLNEWNFTTIAVLIDKEKLKKTYSEPYNPYYFGFALLMERYIIFLKEKEAIGDIMAESINKTHDKRLKNVYSFLYNYDLPKLKFNHEEFHTYLSSRELKMKSKKNCICGLEISDLLVNALKKKIYKIHYPEKSSNISFDDEILKRINGKILKKGSREDGIGLKVFP